MDFLQGYKTYTGLVIGLLAIVIGSHATNDQLVQIVTGIGQIVGASLALYGLIAKVVRQVREKQVVE